MEDLIFATEGSVEFDWAVVIVNWNNWPDTLEAIEGALHMEGPLPHIVLVDNCSTDESVERIKQWARGELCVIPGSRDNLISQNIIPPRHCDIKLFCVPDDYPYFENVGKAGIYLFVSSANNGFSSANNLAFKFARKVLKCKWFWMLNNDAVPRRNTFQALLRATSSPSAPDIFGTAVMEYYSPEIVQSCGGLFNFIIGRPSHYLDGSEEAFLDKQPDWVKTTYPQGASMVVNTTFIDEYGYMDERLFMYYDELCWIVMRGKPYECEIYTKARTYHKGSATSGFDQSLSKRNPLMDYYLSRNRILVGRLIGPTFGILYFSATLYGLAKRGITGNFGLLWASLQGMLHGFLGRGGMR